MTRRSIKNSNAPDYKDSTLGELIKRYLKTLRVAKQGTVMTYQTQYNVIRDEKVMRTKIVDLTPDMLMDWFERMSRVEGYSFSTLNVWHSGLIKPALDMAMRNGAILTNPSYFKLNAIISKTSKKGRELTNQEVNALLDYLNTSDDLAAKSNRGFIKLLLSTGMRVSEMCGLTVDDINFEARELTVNKQLYRKYGYYTLDTVKTESGVRTIPLTDMAIEALHEILDDHGPCQATIQGYAGFILTNRKGMPAERNSLYRKYKNLAETVDEKYGTHLSETTLHSLRHTYCSKLIRSGVSLKVVQYVMGHKNISTTLDVYTHIMQQLVKNEIFSAFSGI